MEPNDKIVYIYSENLCKQCNLIPNLTGRASMVHDLINSYGLLSNRKILVVQSTDATEDELKSFHTSEYIDFLKKVNDLEGFELCDEDLGLRFGLGYDCPIIIKNYDFVKTIAGGSITAAKILAAKKCQVAINWFGGWHHAQRDLASGFCYVNDIVLAIQNLRQTFGKVLYLDLDIHHGDGVQDAFIYSRNILTLSYHKQMLGFFPGTGRLEEVGGGKGRFYSINVPFLEGVSDDTFLKVFTNTFPKIVEVFQPDVLVVQCGSDGLNGDKLGQSNLTLKTFSQCVRDVLELKKPVLFCGGGGYNFANVARLWTHLTSIIVGENLDTDIPDSSQFFTKYHPTYELRVEPGRQRDQNTEEHVDKVISRVSTYCGFIQADQSNQGIIKKIVQDESDFILIGIDRNL